MERLGGVVRSLGVSARVVGAESLAGVGSRLTLLGLVRVRVRVRVEVRGARCSGRSGRRADNPSAQLVRTALSLVNPTPPLELTLKIGSFKNTLLVALSTASTVPT